MLARLGFVAATLVLAVVFAIGYDAARGGLPAYLQPHPTDPELLIGLGAKALSRHDFAEALALGEQARALAPKRAAVYGVIGDAQVELGRYEDALDTIQTMVDLRPDVASYSRVSYLRELQGDLDGAIAAMRLAIGAGAGSAEAVAWSRVQLGHLLLRKGDIAAAEREYVWAQAIDPNSAPAIAGQGRARLISGDLEGAIPFYERAAARQPLPELVVTLGDLYEAVSRPEDAARQFDLARAIQQLAIANGNNVDLELAMFEAERGDPARAVAFARSEVARRDSIHAQDALAWALYHADELVEARAASQRALRLGTRDGLMLFHAGMIELKLGDEPEARRLLAKAVAADPAFSVRWVPFARGLLQ
jgi:tetratricopeptide (TPR) repeat protein